IVPEPDLRPDLVIADINWSPETVRPGEPALLSAIVQNSGRMAVLDTINVNFKIAGMFIGEGAYDRPLAPGDTAVVTSQAPWIPEETGGFVVLAEVDSGDPGEPTGGIIDEIDENNNMQSAFGFINELATPELTPTATEETRVTPLAKTIVPEEPTPGVTADDLITQSNRSAKWPWAGLVILIVVVLVVVLSIATRKRKI
ncbi:MAG: CARDB domain-containing protein, partial [Anaerolineae bacterium]|nr:CARDB domain-containing protein [Anaerolineae bacterium]